MEVEDAIQFRGPGEDRLPTTPASLMFLIGQEAQAIGPTTVYEFASGDPSRKYRPGTTTDSK